MYEFFLVSKFLSKIILLGENLFKPSSLQLSFGLSFFSVLEEVCRNSSAVIFYGDTMVWFYRDVYGGAVAVQGLVNRIV